MATSQSEHNPLLDSGDAQQCPSKKRVERPYLTVVLPCFCFTVCMGILLNLFNTAADQISEKIICRNFHGDVSDPLADPRCKDEAVQSELSLLNGLQNTFELIPSMLCVLPYGMAADKYGRKPIFILNNTGGVLSFLAAYAIFSFPQTLSIRLIWPASLLDFVGGGGSVFETMVYTMASDATPISMRSTIFFWLSAAVIVGRILAGPLTYSAMERGEWFTLRLAIFLYFSIIVGSFFIKETSALETPGIDNEPLLEQEGDSGRKSLFARSIKEPVLAAWTSLRTLFFTDKKAAVLLFALLFTAVGKFVSKLLLRQYIAKRFHFSWAKANLLLSINSFTQLGVITCVLPLVAALLLKVKVSHVRKDALITRGSLLLAVSGHFLVAFAYTVLF